jgi:hypothetical protein
MIVTWAMSSIMRNEYDLFAPNTGVAQQLGPTKLLKLLLDRVCKLVCSDVGAVCGRQCEFDDRDQWVGGDWLLGVRRK